MIRALMAVLALALALPVSAGLPETLRNADNWQRWGSGEMSWLGFRLYRATLWVAAGEGGIERQPHALELQYRRDIDDERLVRSSIDEMRRLGATEPQLKVWEHDLRRIFPAVREGETITGVHVPGVGARFYHQSRHLGDIEDAEFARRFFSIWLDPNSRAPDLRSALLRRPDGG